MSQRSVLLLLIALIVPTPAFSATDLFLSSAIDGATETTLDQGGDCPTEFLVTGGCPTPEELRDPAQPFNQGKCKRFECVEDVDGVLLTFRFCAGKCAYAGESCQVSYYIPEPGSVTIGRCTCKSSANPNRR